MCATLPFVGWIGFPTWIMASFSSFIGLYLVYTVCATEKVDSSPELGSHVENPESEGQEDIPHDKRVQKTVYSLDELRSYKNRSSKTFPFFVFKILRMRNPSRSATPNIYRSRDSSNGNVRHLSSRSSSPIIFYTAGEPRPSSRSCTPVPRTSLDTILDDEMVMSQMKSPEELMDYYHDDPSTLPQGDVLGRVQWIHQNNGRIRTIGRVQSTRDLFFHFNDVELDEGEQLNVGDRVLFQISVYKNLVCATHIRRVHNTRSRSSINVPT